MIVKGLIKTINFSDNSCTVRLPIFETAASQGEVILKAVMLTQPGLYNGYSEGDIVFVDFENDKLNQPIVLGKLYLGAAKEETSPVHSSLAVSNLTVTSKATLPIDTQLVLEDTGNTVAVENGITTYKSLTDIIKALYKTETSVDKTTKNQAEAIANIKVEYLSQLASKSAPEATDPKWTIAIPNYRDSYAIWQKTTCYNHRGQILSREIICLTNINSSAAYRLRCSTRVHAGPNQTEALTVKAMVKIGSSIEVEDDSAILRYRWGEYDTPKEIAGSSLYFSGNDLQDKNLIVEFLHRDLSNSETYNLYDTETIMYAPLNTPVIYFSKDTDVILYTADGAIKLGDDVENTAELYVNGDILPAEFTWSWDPALCTCDYASETNPDSKTIIVTGVNSDSRTGTATCTAIVTKEGPFFEKSYTKDFTVTQTRVGENATSYWLVSSCTVHTGKKYREAITITAMKQFGTSTEEVDTSAILWWKYKSETSQAWKKAENDKYRLAFTYNSLLDDDILILATHNTTFDPNTNGVNIATDQNIYEREEITFSPLNTPILSLTNDSGAIPYGSNGQKMNPDDTVSTTAELYLNGTKLPDKDITYVWETVNCTAVEGESLTTPTITIKDLSTNTASAICTATYKEESYTKTFTVVKQIQGVSIVSQTTYYALVHNKFPYETSGKTTTLSSPSRTDLTVYVQAGDDTTSKRSLNRLDQATTSTAIEAAETWGEWSITPPAHTEDTNGWKFWTTIETIYSSGAVSFSKPIINEDLSGVYALAQGKSTNYYSDTDPSEHYTIKEGDCWFKTTGTNTELEGSPNKGELKQWTNGAWKDIGSEIVANKLTATYINALNIIAKKIKILNDDGNTTLFEADGLDKQHKVTIGGFEVNTTGLYTAGVDNKTSLDDDSKPGVYIGADGISIGKGFKVEAGGNGDTQVTLSEEVSKQISAVSYWISSTCTVHTGSKHGQAITVTAMKKIGNAEESQDTEAYLWWRYKNATKANGESSDWTLAAAQYRINFTFPDEVPDDDILIIATHSATFNPNTEGITIATDPHIYEREEIPFSPLNTPILNLTNDSGALAYNGITKIGSDTVSSTAELWLNGSKITTGVTYSWALSGCKTSSNDTSSAEATVTVKTLSVNTATATCTATYNGQEYTKVFTISKQLKGNAGVSPITLEIENDYDSIPCTADGVIDSNYDYATNTKHKLRLFEGTTAKAFKVAASRPTSGNTDYVIVYSIETGITASLTSRTTASSNAYEASITELTTDKAKINYTVYYGTSNTVLATGCFTAEKRYAGDAAVDYYILADQTQVLYNPNTNTYTPSNQTVNFTFWKKEGDNNPIPLTDSTSTFTYSINGGTKTSIPTTGTVERKITSTTTISLYTNDTLLDTETVSFIRDGQNGSDSTVPGPDGRSVLSTIKYYKLTNTTPDITSSYTKENPPSGWSPSPETFTAEKEGYDYYETTRTAYDDNTYSWSTPVKNSMLTVDFLNALGITAKKIEVKTADDKDTIFLADGLKRDPTTNELDPTVEIGGFKVDNTKLFAGSEEEYVELGTNAIILGGNTVATAPFSVTNTGNLKATTGEISGFTIGKDALKVDDEGNITAGPVFKSNEGLDKLSQFCSVLSDTSGGWGNFSLNTKTVAIEYDGQDVTQHYCVYESESTNKTNGKSHSVTITFKENLSEFSFYVASSTRGDQPAMGYINVSYLNKTSPLDKDKANTFIHTYGNSLTLEDLERTDATSTTEISHIDLCNIKVKKVTFTGIKKNDKVYILLYRSPNNGKSGVDRGWLIFPNTPILERYNRVFITPTGSSTSINGTIRDNWGLTVGDSFGVALDGQLSASKVNLSGQLSATGGNIGGFSISENSLASENIILNKDNFTLTSIYRKELNEINLGITKGGNFSYPHILFSNKGIISDQNKKCGFCFYPISTGTTHYYKAVLTVTGSNTAVTATVTLKEKNSSGTWVTLSGGLPYGSFSMYVKVMGKDNPMIGNSKPIYDYTFFYITKGEYTDTHTFKNTDFDTVTSYFFVNRASDIAEITSGSTEYEWEFTPSAADALISLGSIIPGNTAGGWENCNLGALGNFAWYEIYGKNFYNSAGTAISSDKKAKNSIEYDISKYDALFDRLKPASYKYNDGESGRTHLGFIAQDIQEAIEQTNLTSKDCSIIVIKGDGLDKKIGKVIDEEKAFYYIRPDQLHALEVRQIQLLKAQVKQQEATITELTRRLEKLENKN